MAIERKTSIANITIDEHGYVAVSLSLQVVDGAFVYSSNTHRVLVHSSADMAAEMEMVNTALVRENIGVPLSEAGVQLLVDYVAFAAANPLSTE